MIRREGFLAGGIAVAGATVMFPRGAGAAGRPERPNLRFGLAVDSAFGLPVYIALAKTWAAEGLNGQLFAFNGDAQVSQALIGDSVDAIVASTTGLITMIGAQQPVSGFYAGLDYAGFTWLARPEIKRWADLRGKSLGIATFGSLNDSLTRYALQHHGLTPERDVNMIQAGTTASCYQGLVSGRLDGTILSAPYSWNAQAAGMTTLGTQAKDVAPTWPAQCFSAKKQFISENPNTITAILRAHVAAIRLARADKAFAARVLSDRLKLPEADAARAIDENMQWYDEHGRLPQNRYMKVFWEIEAAAGLVKAPLEPSRFLDTKYIDSFASWAPRR
jgi:ABC-type nitrate/sulfonate/bicarbonate transport system substrate-binding protein